MRLSVAALALGAACFLSGVHTAGAAETMTLEGAVREALAENPDLSAARHAIDMARGRLRQSGLWPNPEIELDGKDDFLFGGDGERGVSSGFVQRFPIARRLGKAKDVARVDIALAEAELLDAERNLIGEVSRLVYRLRVLERKALVQDEVIRTAESLASVARKRLSVAEASEVDVNLFEVEAERLRQERIVLDVERRKAESRLAELLGRDPDSLVDVAADLDARPPLRPKDQLIAEALSRRADLVQRRLEADRGAAEEKLAKAEKWEDWSAGLSYQRERQVFDGPGSGAPLGTARVQSDQFVGLHVTIPLPFWNRNQGRIAETRASQGRARALLAAAELRAKRETETAWFEVRRMEDVVRSYRERILTLTDRNLKLLHRGYADGLVGVAEVFQAQQQYANLRQAYYDALGDLWRARVDLETAGATSPWLPTRPGTKTGGP